MCLGDVTQESSGEFLGQRTLKGSSRFGGFTPGVGLIYWELMVSALWQGRQAQVVKYILLWAIFKAMGFVRICVKVGLEAPVKK